MPWDYGRCRDGVMVVVVFPKVATMQGGAWPGDVKAECASVMIQGDCSGRGRAVLVCVDIASCFQPPDDILPVSDLTVEAMSGGGGEEGIEDLVVVRVIVGTVVFGMGHSAAQNTLDQLRAACRQGRWSRREGASVVCHLLSGR
jgi:hypothetical protein